MQATQKVSQMRNAIYLYFLVGIFIILQALVIIGRGNVLEAQNELLDKSLNTIRVLSDANQKAQIEILNLKEQLAKK